MISMAFLIRLGISLGVGIFVARQLRSLIPKLITRTIPMKDRMAENFLQQLSRKSALAGIGLALLLTTLVFGGLSSVWTYPGTAALKTSDLLRRPAPVAKALEEPAPLSLKPAEEAVPQEQAAPLAPAPVPALRQSAAPQAPSPSGEWYLQIGAFALEANAYQALQAQAGVHGQLRVYMATDATGGYDEAPWKVLLGPFPSAPAARSYRNRYGVRGFPHHAAGLRFY